MYDVFITCFILTKVLNSFYCLKWRVGCREFQSRHFDSCTTWVRGPWARLLTCHSTWLLHVSSWARRVWPLPLCLGVQKQNKENSQAVPFSRNSFLTSLVGMKYGLECWLFVRLRVAKQFRKFPKSIVISRYHDKRKSAPKNVSVFLEFGLIIICFNIYFCA
jgi:hypothetical protein